MGNILQLSSTCSQKYHKKLIWDFFLQVFFWQALIRHNAAVEGANTSVTPTEDFQLVLDRYFTTVHQPPFLIENVMHEYPEWYGSNAEGAEQNQTIIRNPKSPKHGMYPWTIYIDCVNREHMTGTWDVSLQELGSKTNWEGLQAAFQWCQERRL